MLQSVIFSSSPSLHSEARPVTMKEGGDRGKVSESPAPAFVMLHVVLNNCHAFDTVVYESLHTYSTNHCITIYSRCETVGKRKETCRQDM
jgi:hypothetical protein